MVDPRFYSTAGPFDLEELANVAAAELRVPDSKSKFSFIDVAALHEATSKQVSFIDNRKYIKQFQNTEAGAIVLPSALVENAPKHAAMLISEEPYKSFARIAWAFHPDLFTLKSSSKLACISPNAKIADTVVLDAGVVIKDGVEIGENTFIGSNTTIERGVIIGETSWIAPNVTLAYCLIGDRTIVHAGARIGQDGFGFAPGVPRHEKVPQLGRVIIGNDVEIGANSCIDRGSSVDTKIGNGSKVDNLVQIGHNVEIGKGCLIAGQVGIAGSTKIEDYVMLGGQAGIAGHLNIGAGARIASQSGVTKSIASNETVVGFPATNAKRFWKNLAVLKKFAESKKE